MRALFVCFLSVFAVVASYAAEQVNQGPLKGDITLTDVAIEATIMSYEQMQCASQEIASRLCSQEVTKIVVIDASNNASLKLYQRVKGQLEFYKKRYEAAFVDVGQPVVAEAIPAVAGMGMDALNNFVNFISLFNTDITVKGVAVSTDDFALKAALSSELLARGKEVYLPEFVGADGSATADGILALATTVTVYSFKAGKIIDEMKNPSTEAQKRGIFELKALNSIFAPPAAAAAGAKPPSAEATAPKDGPAAPPAPKAPAEPAPPPATSVLEGESIMNLIKDGGLLVLAKWNVAGGNDLTRHNIFTGSSFRARGGAIVSFFAYDSSLKLKKAGMVPSISPYIKQATK